MRPGSDFDLWAALEAQVGTLLDANNTHSSWAAMSLTLITSFNYTWQLHDP